MPTTSAAYPPEYFDRLDDGDDALFYATPRLVTHIDDDAVRNLGDLFRELLPPDAHILDLMSSWRTHLPADYRPSQVVGLGLNLAEMADNPQLDDFVLHDLNAEPALPFEDAAFDAVLCTVSVQYLTKPLELFAEVFRVLRPGGVFVVSFSNRCFPAKAVAAWRYSDDAQHIGLVHSYFRLSADWRDLHVRLKPPADDPPRDPLYALWGYRPDDAP